MCLQIHEFMSACFCIVRAHSGPHTAASAMCVKGEVYVYFGWFSPPLTIVLRTTLYECYRTGTLASVQQTVNVSIFHHSAALEPCWRGWKTEKTNTRYSDLGTFIHFTHKFKTRLANCIMCWVFFAKLFTMFYPYLSFFKCPLAPFEQRYFQDPHTSSDVVDVINGNSWTKHFQNAFCHMGDLSWYNHTTILQMETKKHGHSQFVCNFKLSIKS